MESTSQKLNEKMEFADIPSKERLDEDTKQILQRIASSIRQLSIDAVEKANSGHPGLPLGCAEIGAYLYGYAMRHNPKNPKWFNRDRFILSAGHGSMLLYSCLHLSGFDLPIEELKNFRQLHSRTPGHPESLDTVGVETTTGPLGQGVGNAVGLALGLKILAAKFNTDSQAIVNNKVFFLMSDGDAMEGVSSEASSLGGHLQLDNLIGIYDYNKVSLDGPLSQCMSEDTKMRYQAYGWEVYEIDGHDLDQIHATISHVRRAQKKPSLIIAHTIIGKGSPHKAGTHKVHGSPLGPEEAKLTKEALGLSQEPFYVPQVVYDYFAHKLEQQSQAEEQWKDLFNQWRSENSELYDDFEKMKNHFLPENLEEILWSLEMKNPVAGRSASHAVIQKLAELLPQLISGSADLSSSDKTLIENAPLVEPRNFTGRNIKFGVREFATGTMATGISLTDLLLPFVGTFLTFSDYMRNAIRLCSLMKQKVIYHFTHDSIFLGEDGPTHQSIEHYMSLRAIPNLHVIRPGDANEVKMAWIAALRYDGPTALIFSRQNLPTFESTKIPYDQGVGKGAYLVKKENKKPDYTLVATGSELSLAMDVSEELEKLGKDVRVISMPCWEIFENQSSSYKKQIFGGDLGKRISLEAGIDQGWYKYIGPDGIAICMEGYGLSAPYRDLAEEFGFTVESVLEQIL